MSQQNRRTSYESNKPALALEKKGRRSRINKKDQPFKDGFSWEKYLQQCGLPAAPNACFKQSQTNVPLVNKFDIDNKLEAQDPRNPSSICLATVVSMQGPRILLRLDGSDACNDFWKLVDSGDIYPLGTHEASGGLLQPPLGFTRNMSTWSSFLERNRKKAKTADKECFLQEPPSPEKNLFEIGMKLEAVDKKNPHLICPATIGDINDEQVFISFDGWRGAMDFWCNHDSRDLFPVHWCSENDHPLQEPGNKGDNPHVTPNLKQLAEESKRQTRSTHAAHESTSVESKVTGSNRLAEARPLTPKPRGRQHKSKANVSSNQQSPAAGSSKKALKTKKVSQPEEILPHGVAVDNTEGNEETSSESCDSSATSSGGDSSSEDEKNDSHIRLRSLHDLESMAIRTLKAVNTGNNSKVPETKVENRRGRKRKRRTKISKSKMMSEEGVKRKAKTESSPENERTISVKAFANEPPKGDFPPPTPESPFCQKTSPSSFFGSNREEIIRKASVGWPSQYMLGLSGPAKVVTSDNKLGRFDEKVETNEEKPSEVRIEPTTTAKPTHVDVKDKEEIPRIAEVKSEMKKESLDKKKEDKHESVEIETKPSNKLQTSLLLKNDTKIPSPRKRSRNPRDWTTYDVMYFIQEQDDILASYSCLFPLHEIDGEALILLTSVMAVKFMGLKLGPALKLASVIDKLKRHAGI